jgi:hypothetical protein
VKAASAPRTSPRLLSKVLASALPVTETATELMSPKTSVWQLLASAARLNWMPRR